MPDQLPVNHFKRAIKAGQLQIGLWSHLSSNISADVLAGAGFDWLVLGAEHSPNELPTGLSQLQAAARGTAHPIVRPPWNGPATIKGLLDVGLQSVAIPHRATPAGARLSVAA